MASSRGVSLRGEEEEGVLLYYKFVVIPDPESLREWFLSLCSSLCLVGRIRVAPDGINVTVGGTIASLHRHINAVESHPLLGGCDFKLAAAQATMSCKSAIANEVGFSSLSVRIVKELVTLGVHPSKCPSLSDSGAHLSAVQFHSRIQEATQVHNSLLEGRKEGDQVYSMPLSWKSECVAVDTLLPSWGGDDKKLFEGCISTDTDKDRQEANLVLLDVRNIYETRIGRFVPPQGVDFLDPKIRQYSDLPQWIDSNVEKLQNKSIFMYCTGGVRCEMASAYIKNKGKGFQNVFQLSGGIQRYLEAFPDGGFFKGKNFVFDYRVAVPSSCTEVLGLCMSCGVSFDDYSSRIRCMHCRMLVLICNSCQANTPCNAQDQLYACELCKVSKKINNQHGDNSMSHCTSGACSRKVKKNQPEIVDIRRKTVLDEQSPHSSVNVSYGLEGKRRLRILCLHGFRQSASSLKGRLASFTRKLNRMAEFVYVDAPHAVPLIFSQSRVPEEAKSGAQVNPKFKVPHQKYAWLVSPDMMMPSYLRNHNVACCFPEKPIQAKSEAGASPAASLDSDPFTISRTVVEFEKDQYKKQTEGWMTSLDKLERVFSEVGPFDGVLGFSQGAAVAASLCLLREESSLQEISSMRFQFVILCSGFLSPAPQHQHLMSCVSLPLNCPSLHIFGEVEGCDRQIGTEESMQLASMFKSDSSVVLKHKSGHIVPCQKEYVNQVKAFLSQFI